MKSEINSEQKLRELQSVLSVEKAHEISSQLSTGRVFRKSRSILYEFNQYFKNPLNHFSDKDLEKKFQSTYKKFIAVNMFLNEHFFPMSENLFMLQPEWKKSPKEKQRDAWEKLRIKLEDLVSSFYKSYILIFTTPTAKVSFLYDSNEHIGYYGKNTIKFRGKSEVAIMDLLYSQVGHHFSYEDICEAMGISKIVTPPIKKNIDDNINSIRRKLKLNGIKNIFDSNSGHAIKI